ncbi:hypothetical protein [uncultured Dubosiella sp.]|uniref:hypothetical protein n=1 Tax=uncultured Dubosiella sp. TaxID=1937011 RepID=UPI0025B557DF|nr:hypothetical protein [uncultured Dubosiella sp.]
MERKKNDITWLKVYFMYKLFEKRKAEEKYKWRLNCEDGDIYGLDPNDYETEQDYEDDLYEAKYGWREDYSDCDLDPEDYETEDEFLEALEEERTAWRNYCEIDLNYDVDPEDYETEEDYDEALYEEKLAWYDSHDSAYIDYEIDPSDYDSEEECEEALYEAMEE